MDTQCLRDGWTPSRLDLDGDAVEWCHDISDPVRDWFLVVTWAGVGGEFADTWFEAFVQMDTPDGERLRWDSGRFEDGDAGRDAAMQWADETQARIAAMARAPALLAAAEAVERCKDVRTQCECLYEHSGSDDVLAILTALRDALKGMDEK